MVLVALQPRAALDYTKASTFMQLENDNICSVPEFMGVANRLGKKIYDVIIGKLYGDEDAVREIYSCCVTREGDIVTVSVRGNGFLYNMVRIIVGTLIAVSDGKIEKTDIAKIIDSKDRKNAGPTAPAEGLYLYDVKY